MASKVFSFAFLILLAIEVSCGNTEEEFSFGQIRRDSSILTESSVDKRHSFIGVTLNKAGIILSAHFVQPPPSVRLARAIGPIGGTKGLQQLQSLRALQQLQHIQFLSK